MSRLTKVRKLLYLVLWGSALLSLGSRLQFLPTPLRFAMYASALLSNAPGVLVISKLFGYAWSRSLWGVFSSALVSTLLWEPLLRWIERPLRRHPEAPEAGGRMRRRTFLLLGTGATVGGLGVTYSTAIERHNFQLRGHKLYLPQLPPQLAGLRIVVLADMHLGPVNRPQDLRPAFALAQSLKPDLVLLPGDFVHLSSRYFSEAAELIASLKPQIAGAMFGTWGNHDHWNDREKGEPELRRAGCQILTQQARVITPQRTLDTSGPGLWIGGVDDMWEGKPDIWKALRGIAPDQPRLLMCHNPDVAEVQKGPRVDLMLSGHTHGGQIYLPGLGSPIVPSRYGQKYARGLVSGPHYPVYVTRGLGVGGIPVRLGVPPEVTCLELHPSNQGFFWESLDYLG